MPPTDILNYVKEYQEKVKEIPNDAFRKIMGMNIDSRKLAGILGFLIGDGYLSILPTNKRNIYRVSFYAKNKEDLELIRSDIKSLSGFRGTLYYREKKKSWVLVYDSKTLLFLLKAIGAPLGDKTKTEFQIPHFVKNGNLEIKRHFLSGLFSAEMEQPSIRSRNKRRTLKPIQMEMRKTLEKESNLQKFFLELKEILEEFNISSVIYKRSRKYKRADKDITITYILSINTSKDIKLFLEEIGYIYNKRRQEIARKMLYYINLKEKTIETRKTIAKQALKLFETGKKPSQVIKILEIKDEHQRLIKELYRKFKKGEKIEVDKIRINRKNFPKFEEIEMSENTN